MKKTYVEELKECETCFSTLVFTVWWNQSLFVAFLYAQYTGSAMLDCDV